MEWSRKGSGKITERQCGQGKAVKRSRKGGEKVKGKAVKKVKGKTAKKVKERARGYGQL